MPKSPKIISTQDLRPGDILLHYTLGKPYQKKIQEVTKSPYTHASIYIGNNMLAEAVIRAGWDVRKWGKVKKSDLSKTLKKENHIAVFRSQVGFNASRVQRLQKFIDELTNKNTRYDFIHAFSFAENKKNFDYFEQLNKYFSSGASNSTNYLQKPYFCSGLIVACYCVVGIISDGANVIYQPHLYSPGDLGNDPTFGFFLGYLTYQANHIPASDPYICRDTYYEVFPEDK